jgi:hypothetical protein
VTVHSPRILDASAVVELFAGHPRLMQMLDDAGAGRILIGLPSGAVATAQAVLKASPNMWAHIFRFSGLVELQEGWHAAVEIGTIAAPRLAHHPTDAPLIDPRMVAQAVREARIMSGVIITRIPEAYGAYDDVSVLDI